MRGVWGFGGPLEYRAMGLSGSCLEIYPKEIAMRLRMICPTTLIVLGVAAPGLMAQSRPAGTGAKPAAPAAKPAAPAQVAGAALTPAGLRTDDLNYGDD